MPRQSSDREAAAAETVIGLAVNVAQLLKQGVGSRFYRLEGDGIALSEEYTTGPIEGRVRFMRAGMGVVVTGSVTTEVPMECTRCLEPYRQTVTAELAEEFRPAIDVATGLTTEAAQSPAINEDFFLIEDTHVLDLTEALRQIILLALPMVPRCRLDCPGIVVEELDAADPNEPNNPFSILEQLLTETKGEPPPPRSSRPRKG